jgi:hypothetical protein
VKLAPVLVKYLAAHKQLDLPGLGSFYLENKYNSEEESKKNPDGSNITFEQKKIDKVDNNLIEFITKETGKMKVLAFSDLQSQLDDVIQFLNTGKPYTINGIGTLFQTQTGAFEFNSENNPVIEKRKEPQITERNTVPQSYIDESYKKKRTNTPTIIILLLALIAIAATVWLYVRMVNTDKQRVVKETPNTTTTVVPQPVAPKASDSIKHDTVPSQGALNVNYYTYILETAIEPRATKRFLQLRKLNWPVELETSDSVTFKIIMKLPKAGSDSTKIKDSLRVLSGKNITIGQ